MRLHIVVTHTWPYVPTAPLSTRRLHHPDRTARADGTARTAPRAPTAPLGPHRACRRHRPDRTARADGTARTAP
ncbi:hypothetical protein AB9Q10_28650, partial [Streptomyces krungchingensis]|uniref:hypothetical protein n=1 Tax=Streptomyces krungchingensis TaxID=1565034 RepID=UPI003CF7BE55